MGKNKMDNNSTKDGNNIAIVHNMPCSDGMNHSKRSIRDARSTNETLYRGEEEVASPEEPPVELF